MQAYPQAPPSFIRQHREYFILPFTVIVLYVISLYNFPLFFFLTVIFCAMLSFVIFIFTINIRKLSPPPFLEVLGTVFVYVSMLEVLFIFGIITHTEQSAQYFLWKSTQFLEALAFLGMIASIHFHVAHPLSKRFLHSIYGSIFFVVLLSTFYWHNYPQFHHEDFVQAPIFQLRYSGIILMLLLSLAGLWRNKKVFDALIFKLFTLFLVASILSHFSRSFFTFSPAIHILGFLLKMGGLYALYHAIVKIGLTKPYSLLLRDLKYQKEHLEERVEERTNLLTKEVARHKKTTQQLTESERRYRRLAERAPDWIYRYRLTEPQGYEYSNPIIETMTGHTPEEFCTNPTLFLSLAHPDDRVWWQTQKACWDTFPWHETILTRLLIDGQTLWLEERLIPIYNDEGELIAAEGIGRDVSQQKQIELAFRNRTDELEFLINISQLFNQSLNLDEVLSTLLDEVRNLLNISFCSVWLIDPKSKDLICKDITEPFREKLRGNRDPHGKGLTGWVIKNRRTLNIKNTSEPSSEYEMYHDLGDDFDYLNKSALSIPLQSGKHIIGVIQIVDDHPNRFSPDEISLLESIANIAAVAIENASLYDQAVSDAQTKLTLLKEVNHRVKNNLAAISGLIYLEKSSSEIKTDKRYQATMDNLISRVRGLSVIHNLLSSSEWQPILLKTLAESIIDETTRATASQPNVILSITLPALKIDPEQSHHLAMVLNELAINSFKHAKANASRRLEISLTGYIDKNYLYLNFKDNGLGFPSNILENPFLKNHVGFELIHGIVKNNLQGTVSLKNDNGALVSLSIRLNALEASTD